MAPRIVPFVRCFGPRDGDDGRAAGGLPDAIGSPARDVDSKRAILDSGHEFRSVAPGRPALVASTGRFREWQPARPRLRAAVPHPAAGSDLRAQATLPASAVRHLCARPISPSAASTPLDPDVPWLEMIDPGAHRPVLRPDAAGDTLRVTGGSVVV